jgi:hypothetical protein
LPFVKIRGFRFGFYSFEPPHEPPHIHVTGKGGSAKLWLGPVRVVESTYTRSETSDIVRIVREEERRFLANWRKKFGDG